MAKKKESETIKIQIKISDGTNDKGEIIEAEVEKGVIEIGNNDVVTPVERNRDNGDLTFTLAGGDLETFKIVGNKLIRKDTSNIPGQIEETLMTDIALRGRKT